MKRIKRGLNRASLYSYERKKIQLGNAEPK